MSTPVVRAQGVVVRWGSVIAVDGVSIELWPGRVTGLLGPSGSGKTTLMRSIVGSQVLDAGSIEVLGEPAGSARVRGRVGYMAQAPALYSDLSVGENLEYFARVLEVGKDRVTEVIDQVDLASRRRAPVRDLSGGELSRTSLAVALLSHPPVLILDEPTVGLDPILRRSLWSMFRELAQQGATLLVSSHVMDEAARCDDLVLMRAGQVLFTGGAADLAARAGTTDIEQAFIRLAGGES